MTRNELVLKMIDLAQGKTSAEIKALVPTVKAMGLDSGLLDLALASLRGDAKRAARREKAAAKK